MDSGEIQELTRKLIEFRDKRDWAQFHNPKDLAIALSIEAAELQELFLWKPATRIDRDDPKLKLRAGEEAADIAAYLFTFCDEMGIDLHAALIRKMELNAQKYPVDKARGRLTKYDALDEGSDLDP